MKPDASAGNDSRFRRRRGARAGHGGPWGIIYYYARRYALSRLAREAGGTRWGQKELG